MSERKPPEGIAAGDIWRRAHNGKVRHMLVLRIYEAVPNDWHVELMWLDTRELEYCPPDAIKMPIFEFERISWI